MLKDEWIIVNLVTRVKVDNEIIMYAPRLEKENQFSPKA